MCIHHFILDNEIFETSYTKFDGYIFLYNHEIFFKKINHHDFAYNFYNVIIMPFILRTNASLKKNNVFVEFRDFYLMSLLEVNDKNIVMLVCLTNYIYKLYMSTWTHCFLVFYRGNKMVDFCKVSQSDSR